MLRVKKSKILDLRRFGKNTYTEDVSAAETSGYDEGYEDGYAAGQEEGGGGESQEVGLADALTKTFAWDYQSHGSAPATSDEPDAFLFCKVGTLDVGFPWEGLKTGTVHEDDACYIPEASGTSSLVASAAVYTYDELNQYTALDFPLYSDSVTSPSECWMITPLYEDGSYEVGHLYVPYVRFSPYGHVSTDVTTTVPTLDPVYVKAEVPTVPGEVELVEKVFKAVKVL